MLWHIPVRNYFLAFCLLVFSLLAFSSLHFSQKAYAATTYPVQLVSDISYGPQADELLDQCTPVGAPPSRPGIIMIHGGGWTRGDKSHYDSLCMDYAAQGYVVTTVNYRLAPQYQWPDQIGDVQLAVRYMRVNASNLRLDPAQICSLGDSAGAQLALLLDELQTIHPADVASIYPNTSPTVQCVVDQFGPTDLTELYQENPSVQQNIYELLDFQVPPAPIYSDASPLSNIAPQTGQALIIQGTLDQTVLPDQSLELYQALLNNNISAQYISYIGGHEYGGLTSGQIAVIMAQINSFLLSVEQP